MRKPKMILFDYGQTLIAEAPYDGLRGISAVLASCVDNPDRIPAEEVLKLDNEINAELGRYATEFDHQCTIEITNHQLQNYLYESFDMRRIVSTEELETVFWNASAPGKPTENIAR